MAIGPSGGKRFGETPRCLAEQRRCRLAARKVPILVFSGTPGANIRGLDFFGDRTFISVSPVQYVILAFTVCLPGLPAAILATNSANVRVVAI